MLLCQKTGAAQFGISIWTCLGRLQVKAPEPWRSCSWDCSDSALVEELLSVRVVEKEP